jgi:cation transport ATPase
MASCCCSCPEPASVKSTRPETTAWLRHFRLGLAILLAGLSMTLSLALNLDPPEAATRTLLHAILASLTAAALIALGLPILRNALVPRITLEHLYLIGLLGAFTASLYSSITGIGHIYYEVVIILLAIYHLGRFALRHQTQKASDLARHIPGLQATAQLMTHDGTEPIPAASVVPGQRLRVAPGETVPVDGLIAMGSAFVEELAHTGEPFPAARQPGDRLLAGSRVLDGTIEITATAPGSGRELDRVLAACRDAPPSPAENLARRILAFFVPTVIATACITAVVWAVVLKQPASALFNALAVTIVACPCALGLAIPIASRKSLVRLRLLGLQPQVADLVERLAAIKLVAFDKTGTLCHPRLGIERIETQSDAPAQLTAWLAAIQRHSTHPVARPFWSLGQPAILDDLQIQPLPGRGIEASFRAEGKLHQLVIGNDLLVNEAVATTGPRRLHVLLDGQRCATAWLTESPRESATASIAELRDLGLDLLILTGDSSTPADFHHLIKVHTGLSTAEKTRIIRQRQQAGQPVLFLGDGFNDSEGLTTAHCGIALQAGSPAAAATAHAVLLHEDLTILAEAIRLASSTRLRLHRLLAFSLAYNACGILLAVTGLLHPVAAALLMLASSATVLAMVNRPETRISTP